MTPTESTDLQPAREGVIRCSAWLGFPPVLDACCGGRMMWFNKANPLAIFQDRRRECIEWNEENGHPHRTLEINPDVIGDFTKMAFPDESFHLVAFDPPHFDSLGENSRTARMYGRLFGDWETDLSDGFRECFRVLKPFGTLIFKWNSTEIPLERVLALSPHPPLFGHTTGRQAKTHWLTFLKPNAV
jgi:hypothetical protein